MSIREKVEALANKVWPRFVWPDGTPSTASESQSYGMGLQAVQEELEAILSKPEEPRGDGLREIAEAMLEWHTRGLGPDDEMDPADKAANDYFLAHPPQQGEGMKKSKVWGNWYQEGLEFTPNHFYKVLEDLKEYENDLDALLHEQDVYRHQMEFRVESYESTLSRIGEIAEAMLEWHTRGLGPDDEMDPADKAANDYFLAHPPQQGETKPDEKSRVIKDLGTIEFNDGMDDDPDEKPAKIARLTRNTWDCDLLADKINDIIDAVNAIRS